MTHDTVAAPRPDVASGHPHAALAWSFANIAITKLGTMAIGIVMARLLGPANFGTFAVAFVALTAVLSMNELGVSLAIVRWPQDPRAIAPTVTTISVTASVVLAALMAAAAVPYAHAMGAPDAAPLVALLSLSVMMSGVVATPAALLQRDLLQGRRMVIDQLAAIAASVATIGLALAGAGAAALVAGNLTGVAISTVMFLRISPVPWRMGFDRSHARELLRFGLPLAVTSLLVFAVGFTDQIVVGGVLGAIALGHYVVAFNLSSWPVTMFSRPLRQVTPVIFARLQGDVVQLRAALERLVGLVLVVILPGCVGLAALAPEIIRLVYGAVWVPAAAPLAWLAALAALRILFELVYDYLVVAGNTRDLMSVQVVWLVALVPALALGATALGISGVGLAAFAIGGCVVLPLYAFFLARAGIRVGALAARSVLPALGAGAVVAAVLGVRSLQSSDLVTCLAAGAALAAVWGWLLHGRWDDVRWIRAGAGSASELSEVLDD
jgi:O-antigen/teichoic acid export membrane protein